MKLLDTTLIIFISCFIASNIYGQAGALDTTFGKKGIVNTLIDSSSVASVVLVQSNGKILVGGQSLDSANSYFSLIRYDKDGSIDNSFATNGVATEKINNSAANWGAIQPDGKIVLVGGDSSNMAVMRFDSTGSLDKTFGKSGKLRIYASDNTNFANGMAIQPDGKLIIVGGATRKGHGSCMVVARLKVNGILDSSFGSNGIVYIKGYGSTLGAIVNYANSVAIQQDGKIVVAGIQYNTFYTTRLLSTGKVDSSFGYNGKDSIPYTLYNVAGEATSITIQPDKKILVAGSVANQMCAVRYLSNGIRDSSFGKNGIDTIQFGSNHSIATQTILQSDGKILLAGSVNNIMALVRCNSNGKPDSTFGLKGRVSISTGNPGCGAYSLAMQPDGKILISGYEGDLTGKSYCSTIRFLSDLNLGTLDFKINANNSAFVYPNPIKNTAVIRYTLANSQLITIDIYNIEGMHIKSILSKQLKLSGEHIENIDLSSLPSGNYFLTLKDNKEVISVKIVKQ